MAEFVEVMKQKTRMCNSITCHSCLLSGEINGTEYDCDGFLEKCPKEAEDIIQAWVKANPEPKPPKYPNWYEYLGANASKPIPEEIAKLLGLEPIK